MNKFSNKIDLLLLCGARPSLINETLESFSNLVFPNFQIETVYANVDLFQGGEPEVEEVSALILSRFPSAVIRKPKVPSFSGAVKWLWGSVKSPYCLHLEDDWIAQDTIDEEMVFQHFTGNVAQVSILTVEKSWRFRYPYHCKWERNNFYGLSFGKRLLKDEPIFTTSPSFIARDFANSCALLMRDDLDPEKQMYNGLNEELRRFNKKYRNRFISTQNGFLISDIGRSYRSKMGLDKFIENGQSVWKPVN